MHTIFYLNISCLLILFRSLCTDTTATNAYFPHIYRSCSSYQISLFPSVTGGLLFTIHFIVKINRGSELSCFISFLINFLCFPCRLYFVSSTSHFIFLDLLCVKNKLASFDVYTRTFCCHRIATAG